MSILFFFVESEIARIMCTEVHYGQLERHLERFQPENTTVDDTMNVSGAWRTAAACSVL